MGPMEQVMAENAKLRAENAQLENDMGTVKQAREMTDRAMASARAWQEQCNEMLKERDAVRAEVEELKRQCSTWELMRNNMRDQRDAAQEKCAKIAKDWRITDPRNTIGPLWVSGWNEACHKIAESIRGRDDRVQTEKRVGVPQPPAAPPQEGGLPSP